MSKCPYCDFVAEDGNSWQEIAHMQLDHPEVIRERLARLGPLDASARFGEQPDDPIPPSRTPESREPREEAILSVIARKTICDEPTCVLYGIRTEATICAGHKTRRVEADPDSLEAQLAGAVDLLREAWLGETAGRRYALHGPTHNCSPDVCQIGQCPAIRAFLGGQ